MQRSRSAASRLNGTLLVIAFAVLAPSVPASDFVPEPGFDRVPYTGPSVTPHPDQIYSLFLPTTPPPPGGYPVLLDLNLAAFTRTRLERRITPQNSVLHAVLSSGVAVISLSCTVSRGGRTGNPSTYPGNGLFVPPAFAMPSDFSGARHPYFDPAWPMPQKDAVMMVQHVKYHAQALQIDPRRIVLCGASAGAIAWMWVAFGPDRSDVWRQPRGQELEDTQVSSAILRQGTVYFPAMKQSLGGHHFPAANSGPDYDQPAWTLADTFLECQLGASALYYAMLTQPSRPSQVDALMVYTDPATSSNFVVRPPAVPSTETNVHGTWSGFAWKLAHPRSRVVITDPAEARGIEDVVASDRLLLQDEMRVFVARETGVSPRSAWWDLGQGIGGSSGIPSLDGLGAFQRGQTLTWDMSNMRSRARGMLVLGLEPAYVPYRAGLLGPSPDRIVMVRASSLGRSSLSLSIPTQWPSWLSVYAQAWVVDPAAPQGFAATPIVHGYGWLD